MHDIRKADPEARRRAVITVIAVAIVGALLILAFEHFRTPLEDWLLAEPEKVGERAQILLLILAGLLQPPTLGFGLYLWSLGAKICKSQEYPPPGSAVVRDTPVVTGAEALRRGRQLKMLALGLILAGAIFGLLLWRLAVMFG